MNACCRLTGKMLTMRISGPKIVLSQGKRPVGFHNSFALARVSTQVSQQTSDAPHVGLVCPYNSEAGRSGYEVRKLSYDGDTKYNIGLLQIHLS
jgi:hypothetical protein